MAVNLILFVLFMTVSCSCAKVSFIQSQKILMYSGSSSMNLTETQKLCRSVGGDLPLLKDLDQDLRAIRSLTIEPVWISVVRKTVKPTSPTQSVRHYTWTDGSVIDQKIVDEIGSCNSTCCTLRLRPYTDYASVREVNCNETALPLCAIKLTIPTMAKLLKASDSFNDESDKLGLATHVLPEFTSQLNDQVEAHKKVTNAVMFSLLAVGLCLLMIAVVLGIIYLKDRQRANQRKTWDSNIAEYGSPAAANAKKGNGRQGSKDEVGMFLPEIGEIRNDTLSTDI